MIKALFYNTVYHFRLYRLKKYWDARQNRPTILCLHRISNEHDAFWPPITPELFRQILEYVGQHFEVVPIQDLTNQNRYGKPRLALSFDDGYADFYEIALPILQSFGFPANHNIVTDCATHNHAIWTQRLSHIFNQQTANADEVQPILRNYMDTLKKGFTQTSAERNTMIAALEQKYQVAPIQVKMMNWDQIRHCQNHDVTIGSHTISHPILTKLNDEVLNSELTTSKAILESELGKTVDIIAPPNGQFNIAVVNAAKAAQYKMILGTDKLPAVESKSMHIFKRYDLRQERYPAAIARIHGIPQLFA